MEKYQARMVAASRNAQRAMSIMEPAEAPFVRLIPCEDGISRLAPSVAAIKKSCMNCGARTRMDGAVGARSS